MQTSTVERLGIEVLASFPHDPGAFTQGLLAHDGLLYESTGLYGRSTLRQVDPESGRVLQQRDLDRRNFGEGLALFDEKLVQLTWKAGLALVYERETLAPLDRWSFNGQGWGLTYDGSRLIMSDGSPRLTFRSPEDFSWQATLEVTLDGEPVKCINELEWVDGRIWGNVWGQEHLVRIDPETGEVDAVADASGLLSQGERRMADVLNGIAYERESGTFWLTGKFWPRIFQVKLIPESD